MKRATYGILTIVFAVILAACGNAGTGAAKDELREHDEKRRKRRLV